MQFFRVKMACGHYFHVAAVDTYNGVAYVPNYVGQTMPATCIGSHVVTEQASILQSEMYGPPTKLEPLPAAPDGGGINVTFVDVVVPTGTVNGVNTVFTIPDVPAPVASLLLFKNGLLQKAGADYDLAGRTVTFRAGAIPQTGDVLLASYRA